MADSVAPAPATPSLKSKLGKTFDYLSWAVLIALGWHLLTRDSGGPEEGGRASAQKLTDIESGEHVSLADGTQKGPLLIKAFASWCGACRRSVWLEDLTSVGDSSQLRFVAVSVDDDIEKAKKAAADWPIGGTVLHDQDGDFSRDYAVRVLPTYILIDENNTITRVTSGLPGPLDIRAWKQATQKN